MTCRGGDIVPFAARMPGPHATGAVGLARGDPVGYLVALDRWPRGACETSGPTATDPARARDDCGRSKLL
jgi:hypothetical protein